MRGMIVLVLMLGFVLMGCPPDDGAGDPGNLAAVSTDIKIVDYGNGLYYFDDMRATFGNRLSMFIRENPELELVTVTGDGTGGSGYDMGYFVYFREKGPCICEDVGPGARGEQALPDLGGTGQVVR